MKVYIVHCIEKTTEYLEAYRSGGLQWGTGVKTDRFFRSVRPIDSSYR